MKPALHAVIAILALSGVAHADPASAAMRDHYNRGSTLFDLGRFGEAAREFEAAYEAKNDPALLYNIGQAYRADHDYAKALVAYRAFLRKSDDQSRRPEVETRIEELQQLVNEQNAKGRSPAPASAPDAPPESASVAPRQTPGLELRSGAPAKTREPMYKKWWVWTIVGVAAAGAATGVALALTIPKDAAIPSGATVVAFH